MEKALSKRDNRIDIMRALGTFLIIIAHVSAPDIVQQIRTFDVVMLVFISGMSLAIKKPKGYKKYIVKRIKKLVLPTYILMAFVFLLSFILCSIMKWTQLYSNSEMIRSIFFISGSMGYIWIVRVYMIIAVFSTVIVRIGDYSDQSRRNLLSIIGISVVLVIVMHYINSLLPTGLIQTVFEDYFYTGTVYVLIATIGYVYFSSKGSRFCVGILCVVLFIVCQIYSILQGNSFEPNSCKFPPNLYYCSYGIMISILLYRLLPNYDLASIKWLSTNSFSIYLWHIIMLRIYGVAEKMIRIRLIAYWEFEYIVVVCGAIVLTIISHKFFDIIKSKKVEASC